MRARARLAPRLLALAAILAADRATKVWALDWLQPRVSVPLLPFLHLTYVENTGAAFGIGRHRNAFFVCVAAVLAVVLLYLVKAWSGKGAWVRWGLVLVAGGALGNLYDRVAYGFVVDFVDFRVWPVFNVADSCISVGGAALAWGMWKEDAAR